MLLIAKIASLLIYPLGIFTLVCLAAVFLCIIGRRRLAMASILTSSLLLLVAAMPRVAHLFADSLEKQYPAQDIQSLPEVELAIVLGGLLDAPVDPRLEIELSGTTDRLHHAFRIWKAGKAKQIFITGGNVYDGYLAQSESEYAKQLLVEWGVNPSAIRIGTMAKTTQENAEEAVAFLRKQGIKPLKFFLITSALHMPRSVALFEAEGQTDSATRRWELIPVSTDILATSAIKPALFDWIPSAAALSLTTRAWHEKVGLWVSGARASSTD